MITEEEQYKYCGTQERISQPELSMIVDPLI